MRSINYVHEYGINPFKRTVYLFNNKYSEENKGVDFRQAQSFILNMDLLESKSLEPIYINMYSIGGDWYSGIAIYDRIKTCKCETILLAHSHASSMSGIILQAADKRIMMPNAHFMIHYGTESFEGDYLSCVKYMKHSEGLADKMFDIFSKKIGASKHSCYFGRSDSYIKKELRKKCKDGDWYLTPEEAKNIGLIDEIYEKS